MGLIIFLTFIAVSIAFATGRIVAVFDSSDNDNDNDVLAFVVSIVLLIVSVGLPISATCSYVKNVETKEYSSTEYNLKKKVITTEEDNTVKLDTIYTFTNKK